MNIFPSLPHKKQAFAMHEYGVVQSLLHDTVEKLELTDEHIGSCVDCQNDSRAWETRALLMERRANLLERISEIEANLGLEVN